MLVQDKVRNYFLFLGEKSTSLLKRLQYSGKKQGIQNKYQIFTCTHTHSRQ